MKKIRIKKKWKIENILSIVILMFVLTVTVGYSACNVSLQLKDIGANIRIKKEIRVTSVTASNPTSGAISNWEEYNVSNFSSSLTLPNSDSKMTYNVVITNYGNVEAGISQITGLPDDLEYSISNYELNTTLCDDNNNTECKLGSVTTLQIEIGYKDGSYNSSNTDHVFNMNFVFYYLDAVAKIGNNYYDTLTAAIADVPTNDVETTIYLLKDTSENVTISNGKNIVFNFNGNTLSDSDGTNVVRNYGTLKLVSGTITASSTQGTINNYGTLYVTGGEIKALGTKQAIYNDGGTVTIDGTAYLYTANSQRSVVQNLANSTLNILGGSIVSSGSTGVTNAGNLTIGTKDGSVNKSSPLIQSKQVGITSSKNFSYYDGTIKSAGNIFSNVSYVADTETGYSLYYFTDYINSVKYNCVQLEITNTVTFNPNGGSVSESSRTVKTNSKIDTLPIPTRNNYVFDGWFTEAEGGTEISKDYVVSSDIELFAHWTHQNDIIVARIGNTNYKNLQSAINAIDDGTETTITLTRNITESVKITAEKNIIFDMQSYNLTNSSSKDAAIENYGDLKIIGGGVFTSSFNAGTINNYSTGRITVENCNIHSDGDRQAIYNDGGYVIISGNSVLSSSATGFSNKSTLPRATITNLTGGTVKITGATINSTYQNAISNEGTLILGEKGNNEINSSTILITGGTYGIESTSTFKYYNGVIRGKTNSISGVISDKEDSKEIYNYTETINGELYAATKLN